MIGEILTAILVYDEMENTSMDEISSKTFFKLARKLSRQRFHNELACALLITQAKMQTEINNN